MKYKKSYLGIGWAFPPSFEKHTGVALVCDEEDIEQSLQILLSTHIGERLFRFDYGCNIKNWTFETINLSEETMMKDAIEHAVLYFEPRIKVEHIEVNTQDRLQGILWIRIDYLVRNTNNRSNMVYPFYFKEGTNL